MSPRLNWFVCVPVQLPTAHWSICWQEGPARRSHSQRHGGSLLGVLHAGSPLAGYRLVSVWPSDDADSVSSISIRLCFDYSYSSPNSLQLQIFILLLYFQVTISKVYIKFFTKLQNGWGWEDIIFWDGYHLVQPLAQAGLGLYSFWTPSRIKLHHLSGKPIQSPLK